MESVTKTESNASRSFIPVIAVVGGIVAIVSLFIYWVDISTTFSYSFFEIPYTMKATAIKVVEGSTDIPDDWHIYCPALAGVFAVIGAIIGIGAIAKKGANKAAYAAIIICGLLAIQFAVLFAAWNFDVMYSITTDDYMLLGGLLSLDQTTVQSLAFLQENDPATLLATLQAMDPSITAEQVAAIDFSQLASMSEAEKMAIASSLEPGEEVVVGYMKVQEVVDTGFWLCVVGGILVSLTGFVGLFKALKQ